MLEDELRTLGKYEHLVTLVAEVVEGLRAKDFSVEISDNWVGDLAAVGLLCARADRQVLVYLSVWQKPAGTVAVEIEDVTTDPPKRLVPMHERDTRELSAWIVNLVRGNRPKDQSDS